jgi:hypothetical protein
VTLDLVPGPAVRHRATAVGLVGVEVWFWYRYHASGADFHYWLHALLGAALGLGLLTAARLARPRDPEVRQWRAHEASLVGHLWSAVPDVLFLTTGALHVAWMDLFAVHITAHFLWPGALLAAVVLWALAVAAWTAMRLGARRASATALLAAVAFLGVAVALRSPTPMSLEQLVRQEQGGGTAWSWVCRVPV